MVKLLILLLMFKMQDLAGLGGVGGLGFEDQNVPRTTTITLPFTEPCR